MMQRVLPITALLGVLWLWWQGEALKHTGTLDGDPFSLFLTALVLAGVSLPKASFRLYLAAALMVVAVSTRDVLAFVIAFSGAGLVVTRWALVGACVAIASIPFLGGTDLAVVSVSAPVGWILLGVGTVATWLAVQRAALLQRERELTEGVFFSFGSLSVVVSLMLRVTAWKPDLVGVDAFHSMLAISSLAAGAIGVWRSRSRRDFVAWLAVSQLGYLGLFVLGGPHGREAVLLQLGTSGVALFAAALARDRALLGLGAFAAFSFPPFPGFAFKLVAASSVLAAGHVMSAAFALVATTALGLGCVRFVRRAELPPFSRFALPVGLVAVLFLGVAPELSIRLASRATAALF
ncbi:MAG TPA: hypothetical protein VEK15_29780 [Vicinamibacteria bacterium]|nr:hypothetical protein [Vicinamibacteria bacterium]